MAFYLPVQAQPSIRIEQRSGNVYLAYMPARDTLRTRGLTIVCAIPQNMGKLSFLFADGDEHVAAAGMDLPYNAFTVLLQGKIKMRGRKQYGDTVLLQKLAAKDLVRLDRKSTRLNSSHEWISR